MKTFVVSDNDAVAAQVQNALQQAGQDCPDSNLLPMRAADSALAAGGELIVVVISPQPETSLPVLREMSMACRNSPTRRFVLAVGPADAKLILRTIREGAEEYIDESEITVELEKFVMRVMTDGGRENPGEVIALLAPSGGSGSSTLAASIASLLARHEATLLLDLKLGAGVQDALLDVRPGHTLADLCRNIDRLDKGMFERLLVRHSSGVQLLAPPIALDDIGYITGQGVRQAITLARGLFPYVVVDMDRTYGEEQVEVLRLADLILLVLRLDFTSLRTTRQTLDHLERLEIDRKRIKLVVNRFGQAKEMRLTHAEEALGMKVFHCIPDDPAVVNRANNNGVPVVIEAPSAKFSRGVQQLVADVNGRKA